MSDKTNKLIRQGSTEKKREVSSIISVRFSTEEEKKHVESAARKAGFGTEKQSGASSYMKSVVMGYNPPSVFDQEVIIEVCRLHGMIGKIGGLMKLAISENKGSENMGVYVREILASQKEVKVLISEMRDGKFRENKK